MKKMNLIFGLLCLLTFTTFTACDDDDDNFTYYADMATVKELDGQWILQSDNCGKLVPDNSSIIKLNDAAKDGQRVIAAFNFFNEENSRNSSRSIELYDIYRVLTKDLYQMPAEKEDSIGDDRINITNMWIANDHLNIQYQIHYDDTSNKSHMLNLIVNEAADDKNDKEDYLTLEFRHNAYGEAQRKLGPGIVSFRLNNIRQLAEGKRGLNIRVNTLYNGISYQTIDFQ